MRVVEGRVLSARARWNKNHTTILTESTVLVDTGEELRLVQWGGHVGEFGLRVSHAPPLLQPGDEVRVELRTALAPDGRARSGPSQITRVLDRRQSIIEEEPGVSHFVRTLEAPGELFWDQREFAIVFDSAGTTHLPGDSEFAILEQAFLNWQLASSECGGQTDPLVTFQFGAPSDIVVAQDFVSVVTFHETGWCSEIENGLELCNPNAAAITHTRYEITGPTVGKIVEADMEINAFDFTISNDGVTDGPSGPCLSDLGNTVTHEVGHFLGFDHTCWDGLDPHPVDDQGNLIPSCNPRSALPPEVTEATMYDIQDCDERTKNTLEPDDKAAVCTAFAPEPPGGGCGCHSNSPSAALLWLLLLLLPSRLRRGISPQPTPR